MNNKLMSLLMIGLGAILIYVTHSQIIGGSISIGKSNRRTMTTVDPDFWFYASGQLSFFFIIVLLGAANLVGFNILPDTDKLKGFGTFIYAAVIVLVSYISALLIEPILPNFYS